MTELIIQSARLVPYTKRPRQGSGYVNVYVHEPEPESPAAPLGSLYIVSEALIGGRASEDVIDIIIATFGEHYYNHAAEHPFPLARFEQAIKATNKELAAHVDRGNAAWLGKLSSVIALVIDNEVHIAHTGSAEGILSRGKSSIRITNQEASRPATPTKTFGSIASGELEVGDRLLLCTPALIHHVPLAKISSVLKHATPNAAMAELTGLLKDAPQDRIGAVICEITTPELAAMQLRSEQPAEVEIGAPENPLQAAKLAAAPLADTTLKTGHTIHHQAVSIYERAKPLARRTGLTITAAVRNLLSTTRGRRLSAGVSLVIIAIIVWIIWLALGDQRTAQLFKDYQTVYQSYLQAQSQTGPAGVEALSQVQTKLQHFSTQQPVINHELANNILFDHEPATYAGFAQLLASRIDTLSKLESRTPTLIKDLSASGQTAAFMEQTGAKLVVISTGKTTAIQTINPATATITDSKTNAAALGTIVGTAPTVAGDGVFILTQAPAVWLYTPATDSLVQQTVAFGSWPSGSAIAAYASNLYILSGDTIYKFVHAATGYSPRTVYATLAGAATGSTALGIDGAVYALNSKQLTVFLSGVLNSSAPLPVPISGLKHLRSSNNGKTLTAVSTDAGRIITFDTSGATISFSHQFKVSETKSINDAVYDASGLMYILAGNKLMSISL